MIGSWPSTSAHKGGDDMPEPLTSRQREILEYLRFRQKIRGDSMKDAGILAGDLVVVRPGKDAPNGSIVVARLEDEQTNESTATVKRLFREANRVRLQPENESYEPIYSTTAQLEGQVVALV